MQRMTDDQGDWETGATGWLPTGRSSAATAPRRSGQHAIRRRFGAGTSAVPPLTSSGSIRTTNSAVLHALITDDEDPDRDTRITGRWGAFLADDYGTE